MAEELFYRETDFGLFIKAKGHVTAAVSTDLRELILARLAEPPAPALLAVDLAECEYMDSTFMGLLVGFHKRFRTLAGKPLMVLRPSPECTKLLTGLGILKLLEVITGTQPESPAEWTSIRAQQAPQPEVLLGAHRNLSELSPDNARKFAVLEGVLKEQIGKKTE